MVTYQNDPVLIIRVTINHQLDIINALHFTKNSKNQCHIKLISYIITTGSTIGVIKLNVLYLNS